MQSHVSSLEDSSWRPQVAFAMGSQELQEQLFPQKSLEELWAFADIVHALPLTEFESEKALGVLSRVEILLTGWGSPVIDDHVLAAAPHLKLIAHAAGTVKAHVHPVCWQRGITVTSAATANAIPVAEFTLASILLAGKNAFLAAADLRAGRDFHVGRKTMSLGNHGTVVGIVGASKIGRLVIERLANFDHEVLLFDPTLTADQAQELGVRLASLDGLMATSDVVSVHAPLLDSTVNLIGAQQLALMKDGATLINTARGMLIDHEALREVLTSGRINAVLDVTDPEPLPQSDPLFRLGNVTITPHIAGSLGNEIPRLGQAAIAEAARLAAGEKLRHVVSTSDYSLMA